ncbi:efflux RND transporter periplasmic adaptor subunit [Paraburkholderia silvatlantica]|uniref:RND family efflux transporter MFP subunit n=1 Tax=Paraburkholderia silvatlantica TaxID=321895 RepID=A0A2U1AHS2_9BURK|nr:efflux RND transporter periplasmic adaptor subunit [Paraburkholderia silvatlantica]MBB2929354.1 RND family efflux transporter MFP subunit [Paraburkholderia silvatlantica]PVY35954.1 RND family efflux transporter MFP subunit [Paraburkholderia silvatlantica]PXW39902.1 RND family efflux transporter MFP subunit [Paraburkholderia silvatlantica]PYE19750.1 RND family efflux transporter MFP subunit [Paraburkholderia silvatlantica]
MRSGTGKFSAPWRHAASVVLVLGVVALAACGQQKAPPPQPRPVVSMTVHPDGGGVSPAYPGDIEARNATPLSFRVNGKIIERSVRLGDSVKPGETLARLDPADFEKNAASAQAQLDAAQHRLVFAKQQLDRDTAQSAANLIARAQLEQTQDAYASAAAQRDQAQQQFALAKNQLRYTQIVADHAGVITAENADTGQNVQAGQAVYQLAWSGDIDVVCDLPERALAALRTGDTAQVTLGALPGRHYTARLRELAAAADPQSRTWRARLTLEHPDADVRLGMTANVAFAAPSEASAPAAFTVPATALFHDGEAPAIWVIHAPDNVLQLRRVSIARYDARTITVANGLQDGERIVLQGVHTVHAGEQVRPVAPLHPEDFAS